MPSVLLKRNRVAVEVPVIPPAVLPAGAVMHYDLSLEDYSVVDEYISSIPDQSGNARTLNLTIDNENRPQTGRYHNGLAVASFNHLAAIRGLTDTTIWEGNDVPYTIGMFVVLDDVSLLTVLTSINATAEGGSSGHYRHGFDATPEWNSVKQSSTPVASVTVDGGTPTRGEHVIIWQSTGTTASIWVDGVLVVNAVSQDVSAIATIESIVLGGRANTTVVNNTMDGAIGEAVYYISALSAGDRENLSDFLTNKWMTGETFGDFTTYTKAGQARRHADGSQTPAANTDTEMQWNTAVFDSNDLLYTERFIVPSTWGQRWAEITAGLNYTTTTTSYDLRIQRSTDGGATFKNIVYLDMTEGSRGNVTTGPILVNANEQFRVQIRAVGSSLIIASECPFGVFVYS